MDEIRVLATRLKKAGRDEAVSFTAGELRLICKFSEVFWEEVSGSKARVAVRRPTEDPHRPETWKGDNYI